MLEQAITIINKLGLHARAAAKFVKDLFKIDRFFKILLDVSIAAKMESATDDDKLSYELAIQLDSLFL